MLEKNDEVVIYTYYRLKESEVQEIIDFIKSNDERALEAIYIGNGSNYLADRHVIAQDVEFTLTYGRILLFNWERYFCSRKDT